MQLVACVKHQRTAAEAIASGTEKQTSEWD